MADNRIGTLNDAISPAEVGCFISDGRKRLISQKRALRGIQFLHAHSNLIDAAITRIFALSLEQTEESCGRLRRGVLDKLCLIATGGFGRRELCPYSDIDITFVADDDDDPQVDLLVKNAYRILMDTFLCGTDLKVGYSFRQIGDCRNLPLDVHTALLDGRRLAGSISLFEKFHSEVCASVLPAQFVLGHLKERKAAGERCGHSPYRVEPNIKEGAGGLRDLHAARWMTQVVFGVNRDDTWRTLRARGIFTETDISAVDQAEEFFARIRSCLHVACGRGTDVLSAERQGEVSSMLGYRNGANALMRKYYSHAETLNRLYRKVVSACYEQPLEIEPGMVALGDDLCLSDLGLFYRDQEAMIRVFQHAVTLDLHVGRNTGELLKANASVSNGKKRRTGTYKAFLRVLSEKNAHKALSDMADYGILQWLIPEYGRLMYQVSGDAAHVLTVGAHSIETVKTLGSFASGPDPEMLEVWNAIEQPELLLMAALLHDVGKVSSGEDHCSAGARMARDIVSKFDVSPEGLDTIGFLIRNHLLMSETARLRDLNDGRAVQTFVDIVNSPDLLDMLYLLTCADLQSVGQATWSEMQMRFLRELYHRSMTLLRRSDQAPTDVNKHRNRLARELSLTNISHNEVQIHCLAMPASYLLNTHPDDIAAHIEYIRQIRAGQPTIAMRDDPTGKLTEITICTADDPKPGLLARIAGVLYLLNVGIHAAQVYTRVTSDRVALDTLYVDYDQHALPQMKKLQIQSDLGSLLSGKTDLEVMSKRYNKRLNGSIDEPQIEVMSHLSDLHSIVQVSAEDQPGLLYRITNGISSLGWNIHSARISTWGDTALDVFYVTDVDGRKLNGESAAIQLRDLLTN